MRCAASVHGGDIIAPQYISCTFSRFVSRPQNVGENPLYQYTPYTYCTWFFDGFVVKTTFKHGAPFAFSVVPPPVSNMILCYMLLLIFNSSFSWFLKKYPVCGQDISDFQKAQTYPAGGSAYPFDRPTLRGKHLEVRVLNYSPNVALSLQGMRLPQPGGGGGGGLVRVVRQGIINTLGHIQVCEKTLFVHS